MIKSPSTVVVTDATLDSLLAYEVSRLPAYAPTLSFAASLLYATGCRATEAVELNKWTIVGNGTVTLQPLKHNTLRTFNLSILPTTFTYWFNNQPLYNEWTTYRRLQYLCAKMFGGYQIEVGKKNSLLHLFRHNYIRKLVNSGLPLAQVQALMGHATIDTTTAYSTTIIYSRTTIELL